MKLKTLLVSVVILAALSAGAFLLRRPPPPPAADARIGQPLAEAGAIEKAAKLRLSEGGKTVLLTRQADGTWRVPSYFDFPADFAKLSGFVGSLTDTKLQRLVTSNAERLARLEFKDTKIELLDAGEKPLLTIVLGKTAEGGGRFIRFGEEPKAYQANFNAWLDAEAKNWASTELLNLKADDIAKIEVPFAEGAVAFVRGKKDEAWIADKTPAGQQVKADRLANVLASIGTLRFTETTEKSDANAQAADANQRLFKLETFDKKVIKVGLGRKPEEKKLKAPVAAADGKSGPAALGKAADLIKKDGSTADKKDETKPLAPEFETIPAGPVFVVVSHGDGTAALVNALMAKRAFQIADYTFTGLPQKAEELFEPAPAAAPAAAKPAAPAPVPTK
jgi:hypothetical protein